MGEIGEAVEGTNLLRETQKANRSFSYEADFNVRGTFMGQRATHRLDSVGPWSEVKIEIIRKYASAYSDILAKNHFYHVYVDAFAGAGIHFSEAKQDWIEGSPLQVLGIEPPFDEYHFIELDETKSRTLTHFTAGRRNVHVYPGDCNEHLVERIFPQIRYDQYQRALCLLDPYGLQLDWRVLQIAGQSRTIEIFLNFPIMDINRNVLIRDRGKVRKTDIARMNRFWGDQSWEESCYQKQITQITMFGDEEDKVPNERVVNEYLARLRKVGFSFLPKPLPMRNKQGATIYYLIFAAHKPVAQDIVTDIFEYYEKRGMN